MELKEKEKGTNITLDNLREIINFGTENGEHQDLEQNLRIGPLNQMGRDIEQYSEQLNSLLSSYFEGVTPARVIVQFGETESNTSETEILSPIEVTEPSSTNHARRMKFGGTRSMDSLNGFSGTRQTEQAKDSLIDDQKLCNP
jgi:hypothetical protein